jgi:hypothetical protein
MDSLPNVDKLYPQNNEGLQNDLNNDKVKVKQDIETDRNNTYIMFCSCFNWLV